MFLFDETTKNCKGLQMIDPVKVDDFDIHTGYNSNYVVFWILYRDQMQLSF